jgi:lipopolysaccharide export system protein LptC
MCALAATLQGTERERTGAPVIRTDALSYDVKQSIASTDGDVRIDFLLHTLTARGLVANLRERTVRLESRINGRFHP